MKANDQVASKILYLHKKLKKATKCTQNFLIDGATVARKSVCLFVCLVCLGRQGCLHSAPFKAPRLRSMAMYREEALAEDQTKMTQNCLFLLVAGCLFYFDISLMRRQ